MIQLDESSIRQLGMPVQNATRATFHFTRNSAWTCIESTIIWQSSCQQCTMYDCHFKRLSSSCASNCSVLQMSDIKSVDELKKLLGMSECLNNVEDVGVRDAPNKENESINENVINVINQIQQQPPTSTKFSQHQCANSDFNEVSFVCLFEWYFHVNKSQFLHEFCLYFQRTSVNVPVKMKLPANINGVDDRTNYTPPMNEVQNRPISPSGSIVSISSSESADINESEDSSNEVDIEF